MTDRPVSTVITLKTGKRVLVQVHPDRVMAIMKTARIAGRRMRLRRSDGSIELISPSEISELALLKRSDG